MVWNKNESYVKYIPDYNATITTRYNATMLSHPLLLHKPLSVLYLDTTYCDPLYKFPAQEDVIQYMVGQVLQFTRDTLIVCGSYTIG